MTGHQPTEAFLGTFDCTWTHDPELDLRAIDLVASVLNQARFDAIDRPTVDRYVAALNDGATFPPCILRRVPRPDGSHQLVLLGGNHRTRAHIEADRKTLDTYLVDCDDTVALEIAYSDNATHGLPPSDEERIAHVLDLVAHGRTTAEACRMVGVSNGKVNIARNARKVDERAARLGVTLQLNGAADSTKHTLAGVKDDRVFAKLVRIFDEYRVGSGPAGVQKIVSDVNAQLDVASAMDVIAQHVRDLENRGLNRKGHRQAADPAYLTLRLALTSINGLDVTDVASQVPAGDVAGLHDLLLDAGRRLMAIDKLTKAKMTLKAVG